MVRGHTSIWLTHKSSHKQWESVCGHLLVVTSMISLLSSEKPRRDKSDCSEEQAVGRRSRECRAGSLLPFQRQGLWGSRGKNRLQNRLSGVGEPLRRGLKTNSCECCQPASARRVPARTTSRCGLAPGSLGWGVTRVPPAAWAEAPGGEPRTLPL